MPVRGVVVPEERIDLRHHLQAALFLRILPGVVVAGTKDLKPCWIPVQSLLTAGRGAKTLQSFVS